uniref:Uncharacterized protein n=1 Tax=Cacopsylla melanoneura TaxID=428564 RepID=A0A8D9DYV0_9HEMI
MFKNNNIKYTYMYLFKKIIKYNPFIFVKQEKYMEEVYLILTVGNNKKSGKDQLCTLESNKRVIHTPCKDVIKIIISCVTIRYNACSVIVRRTTMHNMDIRRDTSNSVRFTPYSANKISIIKPLATKSGIAFTT